MMMNQSGKYFESFHQLANQTNNLLTIKQVQQIDVLLQKCIMVLAQCDKASFTKLLISFFKLFLLCPFASTQTFYKRYYAILKEGCQFKSKNPTQEKYQCLILTLFDAADKYYSLPFAEAIKNSKEVSYNELLDNVMMMNIKGGLNFKGFIALLRKFMQRDKQNSKINQALLIIKDLFQKFLTQMNEDIKKNEKVYQNNAFNFFFVDALYEQLHTKYESQSITFTKQMFRQYTSKPEQHSNIRILMYLQFLAINNHNFPVSQFISENRSEKLKENECVRTKNSYYVDVLSSLLIFEGVNQSLSQKSQQYLINSVLLLKNHYKSIKSKYYSEQKFPQWLERITSQQKSSFLEELALQLLINIKLHLSSFEFSKISPLLLIKTMTAINSPFLAKFKLSDSNFTQTQFYKQMLKDSWLNLKGKTYLMLLYFNIFSSSVNDYSKIILLQTNMFGHFRNIISKDYQDHQSNKRFYQQIYHFMNFKTSKSDYLRKIFFSVNSENNIFTDILELYSNNYSKEMIDQCRVDEFIQKSKQRFNQTNYTYQSIVDLVTTLIQQNQEPTFKKQLSNDCEFNELSMILFDRINIRPKCINKFVEEISFRKQISKQKIQFCKLLFKKLYQFDNIIKSNVQFMQSVPENQVSGQKIIIAALKKYFGIYYNRINELVIRKWIINRQYLLIWSLLFSNYKIKTVAQQFLKCGISIDQLKCFFKLEETIVKEFLEYLVSKDKYKFKLALFNCDLTHKKQLIDYNLSDLIA